MKAKLKAACRGNGTAYLLVKMADEPVDFKSIKCQAFSDAGRGIPIMPFSYTSIDESSCEGLVVLTFPMLDVQAVRIELSFNLANESVSETLRIGMESLKWRSRLLYKADPSLAYSIRDYESRSKYAPLSIRPFSFMIDGRTRSEYIFKGFVSFQGDPATLKIAFLDEKGVESNTPTFILGKPRVDAQGCHLPITARIPKNTEGFYCLTASDPATNAIAFVNFNTSGVARLLATGDLRNYRIAEEPLYQNWIEREEGREEIDPAPMHGKRKYSLVVPLFNTPIPFLREMYHSVVTQSYDNWELVLVNATPDNEPLVRELSSLTDPRVKIISLDANLGIAGNTNRGIEAATGDYVGFLDHDDVLDPFLLEEYDKALREQPEAIALYCDEDYLIDGERSLPHFKPDFNLDLLRCHNYITHLLMVRADHAKRLSLRSDFDGAQDYDLTLRIAELSENIVHVPKVLYHWRMHSGSSAGNPESKRYAEEAGRRALEEHLERCGLEAEVTTTDYFCLYRVAYALREEPLVSIIIPNKDNVDILRQCLESIEAKTTYSNYEILIIENNSTESETFDFYASLSEICPNAKVIVWEDTFNYSAINNFGVRHCSGEYLLFLNNDVEVIEPSWIEELLSFCQRKDVGAAGAKLLYPDNTVQHAGVFMMKCFNATEMAGASHVFSHIDRNDPGYMFRAQVAQDLSAVTGACLMTKRAIFEEVGGFDEQFAVAYNDVDLCLKIRQLGYRIVFNPGALLYHYESLSRGADDESSGIANYSRFLGEQGLLRHRWSDYFAKGDPYHGKYATLTL